ncbi:unnamed protein product [Chilo suppressalis]|uniref:Uncharacterized protein n=1 Tax=Chilo suppressalis TaxID=168631 RepID=A0ABN8AUZ7_CHISP|nr:unnamed protein product [Chilo suppressalis]
MTAAWGQKQLGDKSSNMFGGRKVFPLMLLLAGLFCVFADDDCDDLGEESLSDEEEFEISKLNRSCPINNQISNDAIDELRKKNKMLQARVEITENELENLTLENSALAKKLSEYELKIKQLTEICKSPKLTTDKYKKIYANTTTMSTPSKCAQNSKIAFHHKPSSSSLLSGVLTKSTHNIISRDTLEDKTNNLVGDVCRWKRKYSSTAIVKHNVLLLADERGRNMRDMMEKRLGKNIM